MKNMGNLYLFICILLTLLSDGIAQKEKTCIAKKVEKCSEKLFMVGDDTFVFPQNLEMMNQRCRDLKDLEKCVKDYSAKCLANDAKQAVAMLSYGVTKTNKGYCVNGKRKNLFIEIGKCLQKHKKKIDPMMWKMSTIFGLIAKLSSKNIEKSKIPLACCHFYDFKHKSQDVINSVCTHKVQSEYEAIINGYVNEVVNLFCGEYTEDSDKCAGLIAKHSFDSKNVSAKTNKVFILPMVDIFESLPK